jgi:hypothetical protein
MVKRILLCALALFPVIATADLVHWTCSNDTTVLFMLLDTKSGGVQLFTDTGAFLGQSAFTQTTKINDKDVAFGARIDTVSLAILKKDETTIVLKLDDVKLEPVYFECK